MSEIIKVKVNNTPYDIVGKGSVRYDLTQNLDDSQKQRARQNIGAADSGYIAVLDDRLTTAEANITILDRNKQDKIIAGDNISLATDGKTISASGVVIFDDTQSLTVEQKATARDNIGAGDATDMEWGEF